MLKQNYRDCDGDYAPGLTNQIGVEILLRMRLSDWGFTPT